MDVKQIDDASSVSSDSNGGGDEGTRKEIEMEMKELKTTIVRDLVQQQQKQVLNRRSPDVMPQHLRQQAVNALTPVDWQQRRPDVQQAIQQRIADRYSPVLRRPDV